MSQIFPGEDNVDLYDVLALRSDESQEGIRKAYRKLALLSLMPSKQAYQFGNSSEHERAHTQKRVQQIGFAYAVLSDKNGASTIERAQPATGALPYLVYGH